MHNVVYSNQQTSSYNVETHKSKSRCNCHCAYMYIHIQSSLWNTCLSIHVPMAGTCRCNNIASCRRWLFHFIVTYVIILQCAQLSVVCRLHHTSVPSSIYVDDALHVRINFVNAHGNIAHYTQISGWLIKLIKKMLFHVIQEYSSSKS